MFATVRGAAEGIGLILLVSDMGLDFKVRLHIGAAALGIIERRARETFGRRDFVAAGAAARESGRIT